MLRLGVHLRHYMKSFEVTFYSGNGPGATTVQVGPISAEDEIAAPGIAQLMLAEQNQPLAPSLRDIWTVRWLGFRSS